MGLCFSIKSADKLLQCVFLRISIALSILTLNTSLQELSRKRSTARDSRSTLLDARLCVEYPHLIKSFLRGSASSIVHVGYFSWDIKGEAAAIDFLVHRCI